MGNAIRWAALNLSADRRLAYIGSATHQEIFRGLFAAADLNQVVAWCRNLRKAPLNFYSQSSEQIALLKRDVLDRLGERGVETNAKFEDVEKFQDPVSFTVDLTLTPYLQDFADSVIELLWAQIMLNTDKSTRPKLDVFQSQFIRAKAQGVVGREEELDSIRKFFSETDGGMHMITGPGGQGKTSLLALACPPEIESHSDKNRFWIKRFAGAGGGIDSVETLLASMFPADLFDQFWDRDIPSRFQTGYFFPGHQIEQFFKKIGLQVSFSHTGSNARHDEPGGDASQSKDRQEREQIKTAVLTLRAEIIARICGDNIASPRSAHLISYLQTVRFLKGSDLVIVLDGIDQWFGASNFLATLEQLGLGQIASLKGIWLLAAARDASGVALQGIGRDTWEHIADQGLLLHGRRLQPPTQASIWLKSGWESAKGNPLSLRVGLERAIRMRSFDAIPEVSFLHQKLLRDWLTDIANAGHHSVLAIRVLGFLSVAEHGLPEPVLLKLLGADLHIRDWFNAQIEKTGQYWDLANGLPPVLWSRLRMDLGDVLAVSGDVGQRVLRLIQPALREELAVITAAGTNEREAIATAAEACMVSGLTSLDVWAVPPRLFEDANPWALKKLIA